MNDYYVYEHIRLDNGKCFYVGKGHGKRANDISRNEHHDRVVSKAGVEVKIIAENLSEDEAYMLERKTIEHYVYDLGYGIDIIGFNNNKNENGHLTNHTFGGDGSYGMVHSEEWCKQHSQDMCGKNNPMYGKNVWNTYSEEKKKDVKNKLSKASSGKNNPMYGISPQERMDEETYNNWKKKTEERLSNQTGGKNPNAKGVIIYDKNMNLITEFNSLGDAGNWIMKTNNITMNLNGMRTGITKAINNNETYKGYYFRKINTHMPINYEAC